MEIPVLVLALLTAAGGLTMAAIWLAAGGARQRDASLEGTPLAEASARAEHLHPDASRFPVWLVGLHATLAVAGIALWIGIVARGEGDDAGMPWIAVLLFVLAAGAGSALFRRWHGVRRDGADRAERRIPSAVAYLHGAAAAATIVLAVLAAAGAGD